MQVSPFNHPIAVGSEIYRSIPVLGFRIPAGFPSPADDYLEGRIDLNEHLILHKEATFILRVKGWSMVKAGIHDGDELIVDRAVEPVGGEWNVEGQEVTWRAYITMISVSSLKRPGDLPKIGNSISPSG